LLKEVALQEHWAVRAYRLTTSLKGEIEDITAGLDPIARLVNNVSYLRNSSLE
jgi:hypothetical protein